MKSKLKERPSSSYSPFQKAVFILMAVVTILSLSGLLTLFVSGS